MGYLVDDKIVDDLAALAVEFIMCDSVEKARVLLMPYQKTAGNRRDIVAKMLCILAYSCGPNEFFAFAARLLEEDRLLEKNVQ